MCTHNNLFWQQNCPYTYDITLVRHKCGRDELIAGYFLLIVVICFSFWEKMSGYSGELARL
jgi:hypothetical protein